MTKHVDTALLSFAALSVLASLAGYERIASASGKVAFVISLIAIGMWLRERWKAV